MSAVRTMLGRPAVRRILAATGSNAYSQATTIAIQLLSLPLFLSKWDLATYGQWLVLSAVPSYLSMADVGMVTAAGNRMTMLMGDGDSAQANRVFQSVLVFMLGVAAIALPVVGLAVFAWPTDDAASWQAKATIGLLAAAIVVNLLGGLPEAVYRATQRYALGNALANTTRLFEWLGGLGGLWLGGTFVAVAAGALLPRVLCTAAMALHAARSTPAFRWGWHDANVGEVRACAGPAVSFMAFPAANALNYQGMTLVAAAVLGPAAAVIFNTYRTMARVTVQATGMFSNALWPEFARLYGKRDRVSLRLLFRRSSLIGWALAVAASAVVYVAAPSMLQIWAKGKIEFLPPLMFAAMLYAGVAGGWHVSRVLLLSTNEHRALAWPFLLASAVCLPIAWLVGRSDGLVGIMLVMLGLEVAMLAWCAWLARRLLGTADTAASVGAAA